MGDPAGIGPEVTLKAAVKKPPKCRLVILGDLGVLRDTAQRLSMQLNLIGWEPTLPYPRVARTLPVIELSSLALGHCKPGHPTSMGGETSYRYVETAVRLAQEQEAGIRGDSKGILMQPEMAHKLGRQRV